MDIKKILEDLERRVSALEGKKRGTFTPPSLSEVECYSQEIDFSELDAGSFIDFYESKGWMVGRNKMKCWKSAVRTWKRRHKPDLVNQATAPVDEDDARFDYMNSPSFGRD